MRILIANKFMYPRGGDCIVALNTAELLRSHGHEVMLFAMDYPDNLDFPEADKYASRVSFDGSLKDKLKAFNRLLGNGDIRKSFVKALEEFRPDVVHLHNIHSYLSPVIGKIAHEKGIKVVWTLHDYKLLCPSYSCRRPDGSNCEECFKGDLAVMRNRCMKGSRSASLIANIESRKWNHKKISDFTSTFICPSQFMADCMKKGGFAAEQIKIVTNFADPEKYAKYVPLKQPEDYFCYVGRLSEEKGVVSLVKAAKKAGVRLKIAGDGPMKEHLKELCGNSDRIEFLGVLDCAGVASTLHHASASVLPSEWYENNPLGVIESLCIGTPVIGADIAGIPELLRTENSGTPRGVTFPSGDVDALAETFKNFNSADFDRDAIAREARAEYSPESHYTKLINIYCIN